MTFDYNQLANQKTPLSIGGLLASLLLLSLVICVLPLVSIEAGADETCPHPCPRDTGDTEHLLGLLLLSYAQASYDVVRTGATSSHMDPSH